MPSAFEGAIRYEGTSSPGRTVPTPRLGADGTYTPRADGRPMQVFDQVDTRLLFGDFFAKLRAHYG